MTAFRDLVLPRTFTARFTDALRDAPPTLGLGGPLQWPRGGTSSRRAAAPCAPTRSRRVDVTREHLSRAFSAGAANLKRVIDLVRLIAAAELAKNPGYDVADVATVLGFASPSHFANTAYRVAGIPRRIPDAPAHPRPADPVQSGAIPKQSVNRKGLPYAKRVTTLITYLRRRGAFSLPIIGRDATAVPSVLQVPPHRIALRDRVVVCMFCPFSPPSFWRIQNEHPIGPRMARGRGRPGFARRR